MKSDLDHAMDRTRAKNEPLDLNLVEMLVRFLLGNRDWIGRQVLKITTPMLVGIAVWMESKGISAEGITAFTVFMSSLVVWAVELVLSWIARKNARKAIPIQDTTVPPHENHPS